jgi:hypothetical protein
MQAATAGLFDEIDRQLSELAHSAAMPETATVEPEPSGASGPPALPVGTAPLLRPLPPPRETSGPPRTAVVVAGLLVAVTGLGLIAAVNILHLFGHPAPLTGRAAVDSVVTRILVAESRGAPDPKNSRSSAAGPAQFLDDTWLELMRAYRPDLVKGHTRDELLALRQKRGLAREIAQRFAERNAATLTRRGLPVTAGTLYLAHFAGAAGAVALLEAQDSADAAAVMAKADASGRTRREQIVKANPFLDTFTVADIKRWAERKMDGPTLVLTQLLSAVRKK